MSASTDHDSQDPQPATAPEGTLQELFPALSRPTPRLPLEPLHARVLEVSEPDGRGLVLTCWRSPGGAASLHAGLRPRVEAALLAELSRPASELRELTQELCSLRLTVFDDIGGDVPAALRAFGLAPVSLDDVRAGQGWRDALAHLRGEAQQHGHEVPDEPLSAYQADIRLPEGEAGQRAAALESALRERLGDAVFGERPGALYAHLAKLAPEHLGLPAPEPTCDSLAALEHALVSLRPGPIRYIAPATFQALCDFVAVIAAREFNRRVEWAPSEPDELGLTPPPLVRAYLDDAWVHIPLGLHLLRWCIMPLQPGEVVPPLSDWVLDQFGQR
ncbi:MAG: hypothetical protein KC668_02590 [Myxococcales bacterium]|nr:hypothetical protein [Myxococcales bacterium]